MAKFGPRRPKNASDWHLDLPSRMNWYKRKLRFSNVVPQQAAILLPAEMIWPFSLHFYNSYFVHTSFYISFSFCIIVNSICNRHITIIKSQKRGRRQFMWMEGLGRKVLFGILQPRKALKSLMKPRKFSGTDQKCMTIVALYI